ncbi:twin-arginine translocation signal domain-containing protein [Halorubrum sp. SP3]|uniref:glycoside hydrolase family 3 N-terminal domain-containing protein n=1 Tax=Halorubrum sp. SP3 TaxID=1537265 RepID=UPI0010F6BD35|nr:glycoside hydrolase family 3 N-terminal domain-containing protein [Halorubrum sp. SP3]TKX56046.1 twin-arginine translocation signal domain-containing protein [Halorubrum sp. SP3]
MADDSEPADETDGTSRRTFMKATGAATATAAVGGGANGVAAQTGTDVESLLAEMSLREKAGQMTQVAIGSFEPEPEGSNVPDNFEVDTVGELFSELAVGSVLSGGAVPPSFDGNEVVSGVNALQEYNVENAPNGIPFLYGVDATHGNDLLEGATALPQRMNMGAARDPDLVEEAERHTSRSVAAMGAHWTFAPTTDLQRDPRWGRFYEGISEDPLLEGDISRVRARALEDDPRMTACVKHFAAYSVPNNGNDRAPASTSLRDLRTDLLPPYREALEAEPGTVMVNSGAVNGKPAHASHWLLTDVLRERYGFEGVILSDYDDLNRLITNHDYVSDFRTATKRAINAGVDMYMIGNGGSAPGPGQYIDTLVSLVEDGEIPTERVDEAVRNILELKADLGLFSSPTVDESRIDSTLGGAQAASERLAKESLVLLENEDDALPLSGAESVLLTGPGIDGNGNDTRALMQHGGWTLGWQGPAAGGPFPRQNLLVDELRSRVGSLTHVPTSFDNGTWWAGQGTGGNQQSDENGDFAFTDEQESAVRDAAPDADAVVVVLGEGPHNEGFGDRDELVLDESQQRLVDAVTEPAPEETPVVGVMYAGSPRGSVETFSQLDALLFAGEPGSDAGVAVAETLVGEYNPSGRLAFTWPGNAGTPVGTTPVPLNRYSPTSTGATDNGPLYEFGRGLSYTSFEYGEVSLSRSSVADPSETSELTLSVEVSNAGDRAGEHVVDVFNTQSYGTVLQPIRRLVGYERVRLAAGETTTVDVPVDLSALEVVPGDVLAVMPKTVEAGEYELTVGPDGPTATLTVENGASITDDRPVPGRYDIDGDGDATFADVAALFRAVRGGD